MVLEIVKFGDPVLRNKSEKIEIIDQEVTDLINNMKETLLASGNGIGLAAPQVGVNKRLFVYSNLNDKLEPEDRLQVLINPVIRKKVGKDTNIEGCLSVPGMHGDVERAYRVIVEGINEYGESVRIKGEGLLARCLQHENDHLDGVLYTDLVIPDTLEPDEETKKE